MQIPLEEVATEYARDAAQRRNVVVQTFHQDAFTETFLERYQSRFMSSGYAGEELLTAAH